MRGRSGIQGAKCFKKREVINLEMLPPVREGEGLKMNEQSSGVASVIRVRLKIDWEERNWGQRVWITLPRHFAAKKYREIILQLESKKFFFF